MQMLGLTANPLWGQDPKKFFAKVMQSKRLDPAETEYSKEELAALQQNQPKPPQVQVAEINAGVALHKQDMGDKTKQAIAKMDSDRDVEYRQALAEQARIDSDRAIRELELRKDIAILDAASRERVSVEKIKADLAKTAMQTTAQIQLSAHDKAAPQVATPAFEPPGRAEPGHAFTD